MENYKMTIAYDGSRYLGWQRQLSTDLTIQGILEEAVSRYTGYEVHIDGSGRTDAGVHAYAQTANVKFSRKIDEKIFQKKINEMLPEDIKIRKVEPVKKEFHSRYSAKAKKYEYVIDQREKADVFRRKYTYHYTKALDMDEMYKAAKYLEGKHDFAAFTDKKDERSTVRTIYDIHISRKGEKICFVFSGNGFMYHMVRILTGTLLEVGSGSLKSSDIPALIKGKKRSETGFLVPASGLFLKEVIYK